MERAANRTESNAGVISGGPWSRRFVAFAHFSPSGFLPRAESCWFRPPRSATIIPSGHANLPDGADGNA